MRLGNLNNINSEIEDINSEIIKLKNIIKGLNQEKYIIKLLNKCSIDKEILNEIKKIDVIANHENYGCIITAFLSLKFLYKNIKQYLKIEYSEVYKYNINGRYNSTIDCDINYSDSNNIIIKKILELCEEEYEWRDFIKEITE